MKTTLKSSATAALAALALALVPASLQAKVIKVPSGAIQTIQQGVDAAKSGDTVIVLPGTYDCSDVTGWWPPAVLIRSETYADKSGLKLKAAGPVKIVGPGWGTGAAIWIDADNVSVEGFDISGFGRGIVAMGQAQGTQTQITGNTIHDCLDRLIELRGSGNYEVAHNTVTGGAAGIHLQPDSPAANPQHHLHHNQVTEAEGDGIRLSTAPGSTLDHNVCDNNGEFGIYVAGSANCTVDHNQTDNNGPCPSAFGIYSAGVAVLGSPNCAVTGNEANNNGSFGIWVGDSCGSSFESNVAEGNGLYDLFAPAWDSDPACNTYLQNRAGTAYPSLELWDVR